MDTIKQGRDVTGAQRRLWVGEAGREQTQRADAVRGPCNPRQRRDQGGLRNDQEFRGHGVGREVLKHSGRAALAKPQFIPHPLPPSPDTAKSRGQWAVSHEACPRPSKAGRSQTEPASCLSLFPLGHPSVPNGIPTSSQKNIGHRRPKGTGPTLNDFLST